MIRNRITELCGTEYPIVQGGMHYVGYADVCHNLISLDCLALIKCYAQCLLSPLMINLPEYVMHICVPAPSLCCMGCVRGRAITDGCCSVQRRWSWHHHVPYTRPHARSVQCIHTLCPIDCVRVRVHFCDVLPGSSLVYACLHACLPARLPRDSHAHTTAQPPRRRTQGTVVLTS